MTNSTIDTLDSQSNELRLPNLEDLRVAFSQVEFRGIKYPVEIIQDGRTYRFRVTNTSGLLKETHEALQIVNGLTHTLGRYLIGKIDYSFFLTLPTPNFLPLEHRSDTFTSFDFTMQINNADEYEASHAHYDYD